METWDAILSRRNVREFSERALEPDQLDRILEAGRRAPSSRNWQPWDFVAVVDRGRLGELAEVWRGAGHVADAAAAIALVLPSTADVGERDRAQYDAGQATMAMLITAADMGIGSGHSAVGDQALARSILGIPEGRYVAYLLDFGYPAGRPLAVIAKPNRRAFEEVVHRERW